MNVKTIALFVLFLAFGFIAKAEDSYSANTKIPGGIVYSDGKDAIYYDFGTKKNTNLTSDFSQAKVKHPLAVSDNGKFLIWLQNSKFYVRELPIGTPRAVQGNTAVSKKASGSTWIASGRNDIVKDIIWQGNDIKNLSLSPDGSRFAFDTIYQEPGWVFTGQYIQGKTGAVPSPFYAKIIDSFNGIFYLSTIHNRESPPEYGPEEMNFSRPRYGNVVKWPPVPVFMASRKDLPNIGPRIGPPNSAEIIPFFDFDRKPETEEMICHKRTIKKSAHYLTFRNLQNWEQDKKLAAFIYQIDNQWGPIELRVLDSKTQGAPGDGYRRQDSYFYYSTKSEEPPKNVQKCREWEILVSPKSCQGLSWKPDGSLTIQSEGDIYSIDALQIQEGIDKSKVKKEQKGSMARFIPFNNVFRAEPKLVAQGINGACIFWVSNDAFLFLGKDMLVYLWSQSKTEKVSFYPIPSEFYYCSRSPFADITSAPVLSDGTNVPPAISGKGRAKVYGFSVHTNVDSIQIGSIQTSWTRRNSSSVFIRIKKSDKEKNGLEFVLPEESELNAIKDPSQYEYQSQFENRSSGAGLHTKTTFIPKEMVISKTTVIVPLNEIIILKSGNDYAAIKPLALEFKYKSVEEMSKNMQKDWQDYIGKGPPPIWEWMTYEWKFWSAVPESAVKIKTKTWEEAFISKAKKQGWEVAETLISKEFEIGGIKAFWKAPMEINKTYEPATKFSVEFQTKGQTKDIGSVFDETNTDIQNPSQYNFHSYDPRQTTLRFSWARGADSTLVLKIGNKYIAIKPLYNKGDSVIYKWKFWPEVLQTQKISAKTETVPNEVIKNYAEKSGFKKYFRYGENWYANVNGEWKLAASKEEARQASGLK